MKAADGLSHVEILEASGSSLAYALTIAAFFAVCLGLAWFSVHGGPALLHIWKRGRSYRRRLRAARHTYSRPRSAR
jgi:hypothetical protein